MYDSLNIYEFFHSEFFPQASPVALIEVLCIDGLNHGSAEGRGAVST